MTVIPISGRRDGAADPRPMPASADVEIFVFGSNLAGRHGRGAALAARYRHGAIYGQGEGLQGRSYAIPTKDAKLQPLRLAYIVAHVLRFLAFAGDHPELTFRVTPIGCGLAGFTPAQIAPMFRDSPGNVILPDVFKVVLARADAEGAV
jgi:hypothetical protein